MIKKFTFSLTLLITLFIVFSAVFIQATPVFAVDPATNTYKPLAPISLPGVNTTDTNLTTYLKTIFLVGVALSGAFAVLMIILGGLQYMSTDAITPKSDGKERIKNALFGLLLVMIAWLVLNTVNPALVGLSLNTSPLPDTEGNVSSNATKDGSNVKKAPNEAEPKPGDDIYTRRGYSAPQVANFTGPTAEADCEKAERERVQAFGDGVQITQNCSEVTGRTRFYISYDAADGSKQTLGTSGAYLSMAECEQALSTKSGGAGQVRLYCSESTEKNFRYEAREKLPDIGRYTRQACENVVRARSAAGGTYECIKIGTL